MNRKTSLMALQAMTLIIGLVVYSTPSIYAQSAVPLTITIHKAECPIGYQGNDPFGECHENRVAGVSFEWNAAAPGAPSTVTTDGNGVAVIETSAGAGGLGLYIAEQPPYELASYSVYCSTGDGSEAVPFNYMDDATGIRFVADTLGAGGDIVCDWYNVPAGAPSDGYTGNNGSSQEPVTQLPSTGAGFAAARELPGVPAAGGDGAPWRDWIRVAASSLGLENQNSDKSEKPGFQRKSGFLSQTRHLFPKRAGESFPARFHCLRLSHHGEHAACLFQGKTRQAKLLVSANLNSGIGIKRDKHIFLFGSAKNSAPLRNSMARWRLPLPR